MATALSFPLFLARLRDVFPFYQRTPAIDANALEFEDCTYDVARSAGRPHVVRLALRGTQPRGQ